MSIKMKFSIMISLIVLTIFILYSSINEYAWVRSIREELKQVMLDTSIQVAIFYAAHKDEPEEHPSSSLQGGAGGRDMFDLVQRLNTNIKEITVFKSGAMEILSGTYSYYDATNDSEFVQQAGDSEFVFRKMIINGKTYYRSYYSNEKLGDYTISIVYDGKGIQGLVGEKRTGTFFYFLGVALLVLFLSYWLVGNMIRPLKDILWKVNEVSSVRFHQPIRIRRKDEFGLLALKVNAMSQNLSIYMEKLRKAFEENRQMKEHLESFINHTSDAIHLMERDGTVIQVNRAFELLYGYEEEEAIGLRFPILPDSHKEEMEHMLGQLFAGKVLPAKETLRMTKSGELIPVSITISPIRDSDGTIQAFASISRDMRSRNKMEELLRRSEKLTTVGQLAAGVAHEIRNPLTTLRGFLQLQQQTERLNLSHVAIMLSELDRINLIVGEFLILAKPQAARFVRKDVRNVLEDVIALMNSEAHLHNIEFKPLFTEDSCFISCEENQLKQVFINLLKNAIEAMPAGGPIHIHVTNKRDTVSITITDEGTGIPEDMLSRIGDPFFTGKESGTGLGIMVSQRIIHNHKGMMDFQSQVNAGTSVFVSLPALKDKAAGGILEASSAVSAEGAGSDAGGGNE